jgi:NADP-dependent 3-hydroxy acid dehydrogenase YdfG
MVAPSTTSTSSTSTSTALPAFVPTNPETSGVIVTVTGAGGYLGEHLVKTLLEHGYTVRGTVRDPSKEEKLEVLKALPDAAERLTFHAADLLVPGSFDSVVEGATYVVHSASPVALEVVANPEETLIRPAVEGTENVLASVQKSTTVKRVVLTGSFRAVFGLGDEHPKGYVYTGTCFLGWLLSACLLLLFSIFLSEAFFSRLVRVISFLASEMGTRAMLRLQILL